MKLFVVLVERIDHHLVQLLRIRFLVSKNEVDLSFLAAFAITSRNRFFLEIPSTTMRTSLSHDAKAESFNFVDVLDKNLQI